MDSPLVGSWQLEGVSTLRDRPDPDASDEVWKANRAAPQHRIAFRGVGFVFRADGTGHSESRRDPPLRAPEPFKWRVETEDGRLYLVLSDLARTIGCLRLWVSSDGQKMLWAMSPSVPDPPTASLLVRDGAAPVGRRAKPRRRE
jgi:hypothetical protein